MTASGHLLDCRNLRKTFGDLVAVDSLTLHIAEGETYGLLGPNGAGKTTSISMISGLLEKDAGEVLIDGVPLTTTSVEAKAAIGLVPQDLAIYPDLTARENLRFFARLYGMSGKEAKKRIGEVLDIIGLSERADDMAKEYSGGMQRRLNIGIGLLHRPRLLVLDEPTVGVDPQSRNAILESVARLSDEGIGVLYTTHYMEEAERLCDRVGIIDLGELRAEGTRHELVGLVGEHDRVQLTATGDLDRAVKATGDIGAIREASIRDGGIDLIVDQARGVLPDILAKVTSAGISVRSVEVKEPDLEAVFLHITGKGLRD
jgi:ABC-2 type transport system ATP-binding protein